VKRMHLVAGAVGLIAVIAWVGCQPAGTNPIDTLLAGGTGTGGATSVGDVTNPDHSSSASDPDSPLNIRARVRNESSARADVTLRFIRDSKVVHLAFVRVQPDSITTVNSPEIVDSVELSGVDQLGRALDSAVYVFGIDFDASKPADYLVRDPSQPERPTPSPEPVTLVRLTLLEPSQAVTVALGGTLTARWADEASASGLLTLSLRPVGGANAGQSAAVGPAVGAGLDGINDELLFIVQGVEPGAYQLVGQIDDGAQRLTAVAPGRIQVVRDPENVAPTIALRGSAQPGVLSNGDGFTIAWDDDDPDDNATISFELVAPGSSEAAGQRVALGPPIAENPDGPVADAATFVVRGVLPGLYDLLATIDDGELLGSSRLAEAIRVLPARDNDPPRLTLLQPASDLNLEPGQSFLVRWDDSDANDDARISLLLDPDLGNVPLDGDEILLVASIGEDADGAGDRITLGLPADLPLGSYRIIGVISDGLTESMTRAPGILGVAAAGASNGNTNGNGNGNSNSNANGNANGNDNSETGDGGGVIIVPFPDPTPTVVTQPGTPNPSDLVIPPDELATWVVESAAIHLPGRGSAWIYASNVAYGGSLRLDVTPEGFPPQTGDPVGSEVSLRTDLIPNLAWPRKFNIEVQTVANGVVTVEVSPTPLWVLQRAEVVNAAVAGTRCVPVGSVASGEPVTLQYQWYGGGVVEVGPHANVEFWLTTDGKVPPDGTPDVDHRLLGRAAASPNRLQTGSVNLTDLLSDEHAVSPLDGENGISRPSSTTSLLEAEGYFLVASIRGRGDAALVSSAYPTLISVCGPESTPVEESSP